MKINSAIPSIGSTPDGGRTRAAGPAANRSSTQNDAQVDLSSLSSLVEMGSAGPTIDAKRVAEIKQAISEGRFKINPERIADGLLNNVRQMLAKSS